MSAAPPRPERTRPLRGWLSLIGLGVVSIYSVIDRQIFVLLAEPVRQDLKLSDTQLGLLQGVALTLVGVLTTYPIAWLADRFDRRWVTAGCIILWSGAVIGCALAPDFGWLLVFAALVGIGEVAVGPTSYAMIPDLFPEARRQLANSVYAVIVRIGISAGAALTGLLIANTAAMRPWLPAFLAALPTWRLSFVLATFGLPVAVGLLLLLPRHAAGPRSGLTRGAPPDDGSAGAGAVLDHVRRHWQVQTGFFGAMMLAVFGFQAVAGWIPIIAARDFGQMPIEAGAWLGGISLVTGGLGFLIGSLALGWLQPRTGRALPIQALAVCALLGALTSVPIAFARDSSQLYLLWGAQLTILAMTVMILPTVLQNMSPRPLRARMFALTAIAQLIAGGLSPVAVGMISDALVGFAHPLLMAAVMLSTIAGGLSAIILWRIAAHYGHLVEALAGA